MKTFLNFTLTLAFMFTAAVSFANEPTLEVVKEGNSKRLVFRLDTQSQKTIIKLMDNENNVIYSEVTSEGTYAKKFDLKELKKGAYFFKMENEQREIVYGISLESRDIKILERKENTKPIFRRKGDIVLVNLLNLELKPVTISIYDSQNRKLFKESMPSEQLIQKALNFEKAFPGAYTIIVEDGHAAYYEKIGIK